MADEEEEEACILLIKEKYFYSNHWIRNIINEGLPVQLNNAFRISQFQIRNILILLSQNTNLCLASLEIHFLCFLYFVSRKISFRDLREKFGIFPCIAKNYVLLIAELLLKLKGDFLKLPAHDEFRKISNQFLLYSNLQNSILILDGTHVKIKNPDMFSNRFINRKGHSS